MDDSSVRVAVRIRPPLTREIIDGCQICTSVTKDTPQVWIGVNHAFTYDYVFDSDANQDSVFQTVKDVVDGCLEGYNATILAYGQTGSGKTYTMGTGFDVESLNSSVLSDNQGIIPRAVHHLFAQIDQKRQDAMDEGHPAPDFAVSAQFVELYNEEVFDLIDPEAKSGTGINRRPQTTGSIKIHEDPTGGIYLVGIGTKQVETADATMKCLRNGALSRTTASTNMNDQSSRSHAIFTLHIKQQRIVSGDEVPESQTEFETLTAKFHFVDLAGSERLKRTGAVGERAKEGISINCGLLSLGNVISALGDVSKKVSHVPYRDSKLTRLLQDSLGGNSRTIMIACVSPCDRDFVETLNSLKYANRARNIKNRVVINQDKSSRTIAMLKQEIQALQTELLDYKQGKRSGEEVTDTWHENVMLTTENTTLKNRVKAMQETIDKLTVKNSDLLADRVCFEAGADSNCDLASLVKGYMREIEELRAKLCEAEATCEGMRKAALSPKSKILSPRNNNTDLVELIEEAKREVEKDEESLRNLEFANTCDSDESDDDDSNEDERNERNLSADIQLAKVTNEITVKMRLIEQLEVSQKRIELMKNQYEEKLLCLSNRIKATELERDKVLQSVKGEGKVKETKDDYEKKLASMKAELKKWQSAQKEHAKIARNQAQNERQITSLKMEIENMKRIKVKLMNQVKDEGIRWREAEAKRVKEINQLKKEQRKRDIAIRTLQGEAKMKDLVLKRKHEEVNALKKIKTVNYKTNGVKVSPVKAKARWSRIMGNMVKNVTTKQTLANLEQEMLSFIEERKGLKEEMEGLLKEKVKLQMEMATPGDINLINDDIDNLNAKIMYVEEKVCELQRNIVELTGEREEEENPDLNALVSRLSQQEIGYVFNKMYEQSVASMTESANSSKKALEEEEKHKHTQRELVLARDLLQHIMLTHGDGIMLPPEVAAKFHSLKTDYRRDPMHASAESLSSVSNGICDSTYIKPSSTARTDRKARRLTATPSELLMGSNREPSVIPVMEPELMIESTEDFSRVNRVRGSFRSRRDTYTVPTPDTYMSNDPMSYSSSAQQPQPQQPSFTAPTDSHRLTNNSNRKTIALPRTKVGNNNANQALNTTFLTERSPEHNPYETFTPRSYDATPMMPDHVKDETQGSPNSQRKYNNDYNVFQRLFGVTGNETTGVGVIRNVRSSSSSNRSLLVNVSVAEGHSKPVLSVFATEDKLFTGSKDSTVKIWDLNTGTEVQTLVGHPNNVLCVRYVEANRMILTASHYNIKVWDMRMNKTSCVKTLLSSGGTDDSAKAENGLRLHVLPVGEQTVSCMCVLHNDLYTPFGERVRRWDLRQFRNIGLLSGRHGSAVTCMTLDENSFVTGSKDHSIKVYEGNSHGETNTWNLEPPHYDGVETFAMSNKVLFSGSRDTCIKRWDLHKKEMVVSINNAHGGWITGLAFAPKNDSVLLSSGREGVVKLWSVNDCREIGKVDAHKGSVNCLATNSSLIFTGSHFGGVKFWRISQSRLNGQMFDYSPNNIMTMSTGRILGMSI